MKNDEAIIWKSVNGLDGLYEISNLGSVRRVRYDKKGKVSYKYITGKADGRIDFYKDGERVKRSTIGQLMYEHFGIPTEENEIWRETEDSSIMVSSLGRVYNIRTAHFLEGDNVRKDILRTKAFGVPTEDGESWKDIEGYEGLYQVSNRGRVANSMTGRILMQHRNNRGYMRVALCKEGQSTLVSVHRLVAQAFIFNPNPKEFDQVNHKDENKTNNCADNLEWCDAEYNINYGTRTARQSQTMHNFS